MGTACRILSGEKDDYGSQRSVCSVVGIMSDLRAVFSIIAISLATITVVI
jgi:hypothetical protein